MVSMFQSHCEVCAVELNALSHKVEDAVGELITIFQEKASITRSPKSQKEEQPAEEENEGK